MSLQHAGTDYPHCFVVDVTVSSWPTVMVVEEVTVMVDIGDKLTSSVVVVEIA